MSYFIDNPFDYSKTYYILTTKTETEGSYQFVTGLNIFPDKVFPPNTIMPVGYGYFVDERYINRILDVNLYIWKNRVYIRQVTVPKDNNTVTFIDTDPPGFTAKKIILGDRLTISEFERLQLGSDSESDSESSKESSNNLLSVDPDK